MAGDTGTKNAPGAVSLDFLQTIKDVHWKKGGPVTAAVMNIVATITKAQETDGGALYYLCMTDASGKHKTPLQTLNWFNFEFGPVSLTFQLVGVPSGTVAINVYKNRLFGGALPWSVEYTATQINPGGVDSLPKTPILNFEGPLPSANWNLLPFFITPRFVSSGFPVVAGSPERFGAHPPS